MNLYRVLMRTKCDTHWFYFNGVYDTLEDAKAAAKEYATDRKFVVVMSELVA